MSFSVLKFGSLLSKQMSRPTNAAVLGRSVANKNTLTRRELAAVIAEEHDLSIAQSDRIIKSVFDTIVEVRMLLCLLVVLYFVSALFVSLTHYYSRKI